MGSDKTLSVKVGILFELVFTHDHRLWSVGGVASSHVQVNRSCTLLPKAADCHIATEFWGHCKPIVGLNCVCACLTLLTCFRYYSYANDRLYRILYPRASSPFSRNNLGMQAGYNSKSQCPLSFYCYYFSLDCSWQTHPSTKFAGVTRVRCQAIDTKSITVGLHVPHDFFRGQTIALSIG